MAGEKFKFWTRVTTAALAAGMIATPSLNYKDKFTLESYLKHALQVYTEPMGPNRRAALYRYLDGLSEEGLLDLLRGEGVTEVGDLRFVLGDPEKYFPLLIDRQIEVAVKSYAEKSIVASNSGWSDEVISEIYIGSPAIVSTPLHEGNQPGLFDTLNSLILEAKAVGITQELYVEIWIAGLADAGLDLQYYDVQNEIAQDIVWQAQEYVVQNLDSIRSWIEYGALDNSLTVLPAQLGAYGMELSSAQRTKLLQPSAFTLANQSLSNDIRPVYPLNAFGEGRELDTLLYIPASYVEFLNANYLDSAVAGRVIEFLDYLDSLDNEVKRSILNSYANTLVPATGIDSFPTSNHELVSILMPSLGEVSYKFELELNNSQMTDSLWRDLLKLELNLIRYPALANELVSSEKYQIASSVFELNYLFDLLINTDSAYLLEELIRLYDGRSDVNWQQSFFLIEALQADAQIDLLTDLIDQYPQYPLLAYYWQLEDLEGQLDELGKNELLNLAALIDRSAEQSMFWFTIPQNSIIAQFYLEYPQVFETLSSSELLVMLNYLHNGTSIDSVAKAYEIYIQYKGQDSLYLLSDLITRFIAEEANFNMKGELLGMPGAIDLGGAAALVIHSNSVALNNAADPASFANLAVTFVGAGDGTVFSTNSGETNISIYQSEVVLSKIDGLINGRIGLALNELGQLELIEMSELIKTDDTTVRDLYEQIRQEYQWFTTVNPIAANEVVFQNSLAYYLQVGQPQVILAFSKSGKTALLAVNDITWLSDEGNLSMITELMGGNEWYLFSNDPGSVASIGNASTLGRYQHEDQPVINIFSPVN